MERMQFLGGGLDSQNSFGITQTAMRDIQSLGPIKFYGSLVPLLDKHSWRKTANILNYTRRMLNYTKRFQVLYPEKALASAAEYSEQAIKDCKMPDQVKSALKTGMAREFSFTFNA